MNNHEFTQALANKASGHFNSRGHKVLWTEVKKNVLIFKIKTKRWTSVDFLRKVGKVENAVVTQFYISFDKMIADYIKPILEEFYRAEIVNIFFSPRTFVGDEEFRTNVIIFKNSICSSPNLSSKAENEMTRNFSKYLKSIANRGPRHIKAYLIDDKIELYLAEDFLSSVEYEYAHSHFSVLSMDDFGKLIEHILITVGQNIIATGTANDYFVNAKYNADNNSGILLIERYNGGAEQKQQEKGLK